MENDEIIASFHSQS